MASVFLSIQAQDWLTAKASCERLLSRQPESPDVLHALSVISWSQGEIKTAIYHLLNALQIKSHPTWYNNLGVLYTLLHQWEDAVNAFRRSLELKPDDKDALYHFGLASCEAGDVTSSVESFSRIIAAHPAHAEAWTGLGQAYLAEGHAAHAYPALVRAGELDPECPRTQHHLVRACISLHRFPEALEHARKFVALHPSADSYIYLAVALSETGANEEIRAARDAAFAFGIKDAKLHSALLRLAQFDPAEFGQSLLRVHRHWAITHCPVWPFERTFRNSPDRRRKLRIGFVAAELLTTPARHFRLPLLRALNRDLFDIYVYNLSAPLTIDASVPGIHRELLHTSDHEAVEFVLEDQIDVLVDCSGHQSYGRPRIFGLRAAPVQVAYSGYSGTTGLAAMDCLFTDSVLSPPGSEDEYSEPLFKLGGGRFLYEPPQDAPAVAPLPAASNHHITFGIFQTGAKLNLPFRRLAADVLHAVPGSRLLIHNGDPSYDDSSSATVQSIRSVFFELGVSADRIDFIGGRKPAEHLSVIGSVDIALDTLPFNGHATTCECLWMGVPVLTRLGNAHVGRVTASLLTQVGYQEWIARSDSEYIALAKRLASEEEFLALCRQQLRGLMSRSALTDIRARTLEFEFACRDLWENWRWRSAQES